MSETTKNPLLLFLDEINDEKFETFDFTEKLLTSAAESTLEEVRELYAAYSTFNNERTVHISKENKELYRKFMTSGHRMAAYDATQWKKVAAVIEFVDSDSEEATWSIFAEMITFITQSKFMDIPSVLTIAIPVNAVFEDLAKPDSRYHQLSRLIAETMSKKDQEIEQTMKFTEKDWANSLLIARQVMRFPIPAIDSLDEA